MKRFLPCVAALLGLAACQYDEPLGAAASAKAPQEVVGRWKLPADPAQADRKHDAFLVIHRTAGQRLSVDYEFEPGKHWYFLGYPAWDKHPEYVELEFLGDSEGRPNDDKRYVLVHWQRDGDALTWGTVDKEKLAAGSKGGDSLRKALQEAVAAGKPITGEKQRFTRVVPKEN